MAEDVLLLYFPNEVLENILENENLSCKDIFNFGTTCSKFIKVINSNKLWKTKFQQRWPCLALSRGYKEQSSIDWKDQYKNRLRIAHTTIKLLNTMSPTFYKKEELCNSDFSMFVDLIPTHDMALKFMIDELLILVNHEDVYNNLTIKYYGTKVLTYLRHLEVAQKWEAFKAEPPEKQLLERGAVIVAQWCQTNLEITDELISDELDAIVKRVCCVIKEKYGDRHPALNVSPEVLTQWRTTNITDNQFSATISRQVITAVSEVLFNQMGFHGDSEMYYLPENSYINRRGLAGQPQYIDVFNGGRFLSKDSCPNFNAQSRCPMSDLFRHGPASATQVIERMANNLEVAGRQRNNIDGRFARLRTVLELLQLINPSNLGSLLQLSRFYMLYNLHMDVSGLLDSLNNMQIADPRDQGQAAHIKRMLEVYLSQDFKRREQEVKETEVYKRESTSTVLYAVGMVMRHIRYDYYCVIYGWDSKCAANSDWRIQMNVSSLMRQDDQPFYNVLVNDGSTRYAAEDNLEISPDVNNCWVNHQEIGRYFHKFCGTHYLPNSEKEKEYPDDAEVRSFYY